MRSSIFSLLAGLLIFASGCSNKAHSVTDGGAPPEAAPGCNPVIGDDCLTPFPSSFYEVADTTTKTGLRVKIGPTTLPQQSDGNQILPDRMNQKDGFSPSMPFIVYFKAERRPDRTCPPTTRWPRR